MDITKRMQTLPLFLRRHKLIDLLLLISPKSQIQLIQFNGDAKLYANVSDPFIQTILIKQSFDPEFFLIAAPFLAKGGVFFDIGANYGFCSFGMVNYQKKNQIDCHLFESNINAHRLILQSKILYQRGAIYANHCCVTNINGVSRLHSVKANTGGSYISNAGEQEVANLILDDYVKNNSTRKINFLRMDIEGYEPLALKGAIDTLKSGKVNAAYIEVSTYNLSRYGFYPEDIFGILKETGFELFYCKSSDFENKIADENSSFTLNINKYSLKVANLTNFPKEHQTDILAIHRCSDFLPR